MSRICRECKKGTLEVVGLGGYDDTIMVHCPECDDEYEVEPDGFGEGCLEFIEAFEVEMRQRD